MKRDVFAILAIAIIVIMMYLLANCAPTGINLNTPEKQYLAARSELNILLSNYLAIQDNVSPKDHKKIKSAFITADYALDLWSEAIHNQNYNPTQDIRVWIKSKNRIIEILEAYNE